MLQVIVVTATCEFLMGSQGREGLCIGFVQPIRVRSIYGPIRGSRGSQNPFKSRHQKYVMLES